MLTFKSGNLLDSEMQTLVNTVNCVGVMGKGIALDFKNRYPRMYRDYEHRCRLQEVKPGVPYRYPNPPENGQLALATFVDVSGPESFPVILNFPTKDHWRSKSKLDYVVGGLKLLRSNYQKWGIESIAIPALGCGNGGLDWQDVGPIMLDHLRNLDIPVEIYVPQGVDPQALFASQPDLAVALS